MTPRRSSRPPKGSSRHWQRPTPSRHHENRREARAAAPQRDQRRRSWRRRSCGNHQEAPTNAQRQAEPGAEEDRPLAAGRLGPRCLRNCSLSCLRLHNDDPGPPPQRHVLPQRPVVGPPVESGAGRMPRRPGRHTTPGGLPSADVTCLQANASPRQHTAPPDEPQVASAAYRPAAAVALLGHHRRRRRGQCREARANPQRPGDAGGLQQPPHVFHRRPRSAASSDGPASRPRRRLRRKRPVAS
mmetsp:Transcript_7142/g.20248  ORF Transcript_7142/g.20248 Transcript_7142/m.20248 type:complete len:243 (+) Transcript_7142:697-1425(+)